MTEAEYVIGSSPDCDIVVADPHVSGHHCRLVYDRGGYLLEDLGSTNGTYVNGVRISEVTFVTLGERVTLGRSATMPWPGTEEAGKPPVPANGRRPAERAKSTPEPKVPPASPPPVSAPPPASPAPPAAGSGIRDPRVGKAGEPAAAPSAVAAPSDSSPASRANATIADSETARVDEGSETSRAKRARKSAPRPSSKAEAETSPERPKPKKSPVAASPPAAPPTTPVPSSPPPSSPPPSPPPPSSRPPSSPPPSSVRPAETVAAAPPRPAVDRARPGNPVRLRNAARIGLAVLAVAVIVGAGVAIWAGYSPLQVTGTVMIAGVLAQLGTNFVASLRRAEGLGRQQDLSAKLLRERFAIANTLRIQREESTFSWKGYRKFVVDRKVVEAEGVCSFYLVPHDHKPVPLFQPGQYLTFRLNVPGQERPVVRCYSLSCPPNYRAAESSHDRDDPRERPGELAHCYRVTIKRCPPPRDKECAPGLVSNHFHDHIEVGDILDVQAPKGQFFLDITQSKPIVLIGGGVGITPMTSMLGAVARRQPDRETWLFYGVRNRSDHALKDEIDAIAAAHRNVRVVYCYSDPTDEDRPEVDYHHHGRVTIDLFRQLLGSTNYNFYICGPPAMMESIVGGLEEWGVPSSSVFMEAFGPATVKAAPKPPAAATESPAPSAAACKVVFSRSGKELNWEGSCASLLELAEQHGIAIESGCRAGSCGTCSVAVKSGKVSCAVEHGEEVEGGSCLTCVSTPSDGVLVLDA